MWDQDQYTKAWNYASVAHGNQCMPGSTVSYLNHIGNVAMEALAAVCGPEEVEYPNLLIQCALLHDTIEDTFVTYEDLKLEFGSGVAEGVLALTKDKNLTSKQEKMQDSIARILAQPEEIWMVKLCDRITNLQPPPERWDKGKIQMYYEESKIILDQLGKANKQLAQRMTRKLGKYKKYTV